MSVNELKKDLRYKSPIFGLEQALKELKKEQIATIYLSSNCKGVEDIKKYAKVYNAKLIELTETNKELGVVCKKPFSISIICFKK